MPIDWRDTGRVRGAVGTYTKVELPGQVSNTADSVLVASFQTYIGEKIYGLGERFGPFVKNGQAVEIWNESGGTSSELVYKNIPFFLSLRGYGVWVAFPGFVSFEIQSEKPFLVKFAGQIRQISAGPVTGVTIRRFWYIMHGPTPKAILERYTAITGRPALPPPWTFDLWLSTSFTTEDRDISVGVLIPSFWMKAFQWCDFEFDNKFFPDAKGQLSRLKESKIFDEGVERDFSSRNKMGRTYPNEQNGLLRRGFDGSHPAKMHNYYSFLYSKVTFDAVEKYKGKHEVIVFARAAMAGGQRFPVHLGGDPMSTFEAIVEMLMGGLSLGVSGFGYWVHDIGGLCVTWVRLFKFLCGGFEADIK
ncbi:hypothetical protein BDZ89DRAFT_1248993 [Hymenopellis radicata]|nr:hypothetical protein BDZ89DRAFT_1248993 [Hymenopellis radicata]